MSPRKRKDGLLINVLFVLLVLLLPTQLAFHFWPSWSFIFGIRIDYFSPTIYLTDILVALLVLARLITIPSQEVKSIFRFLFKQRKFILVALIFVLLNIFFSYRSPVSLYKWAKIVEMVLLISLIASYKKIDLNTWFLKPLFYSSIFTSLIGITQFVFGSTIGQPFNYLGERTFNLSTPGIALVKIFGQDYLRAYSTFPHPNALAGFLGTVLIFLYFSKGRIGKRLYYVTGLLTLIAFFVTFSLGAFVALFVLGIASFYKNKKEFKRNAFALFVLTIFISFFLLLASRIFFGYTFFPTEISERIDLINVAGKLIIARPLIGTGLGTFIVGLNNLRIGVSSWLLQPVHNIFLLMAAETGIVGLLGFLALFFKSLVNTNKKYIVFVLLFIALTGVADHYWTTLQQNLLLMSFVFGFSLRKD